MPTDAQGSYRVLLVSGKAPFTACVQVDVVAMGGPGPTIATARGATVPLSIANAARAYDSVRVDVRLP